mgnify:CR=1 FL=1|tara:strand:- start:30385 stop:31005 length:621 start_codon:yes stop_codon:yes gene_type:complete
MDMQSIQLLDFAKRHFDDDFVGTKITTYTPEEWINILNRNECRVATVYDTKPLCVLINVLDGFAPFCKVLICENFSGCMSGMARITDSNRDLLNKEWRVRREGEDEYLATWFNVDDVEPAIATYLHVIVYNREQLKAEGIELADGKEWGIVSINAEHVPHPVPMHPETMLRNRKGIEAGGNGYQHTNDEIAEAEQYHSRWANIGGE